MPVSPGASGMQPRDPCRPWRGTLASGHKPRWGLLALQSLDSNAQLSFWWVQLCGSLSILWHCLSLWLEWNWPFPVLWPLLSFPNLLAFWVQHFHSMSLCPTSPLTTTSRRSSFDSLWLAILKLFRGIYYRLRKQFYKLISNVLCFVRAVVRIIYCLPREYLCEGKTPLCIQGLVCL